MAMEAHKQRIMAAIAAAASLFLVSACGRPQSVAFRPSPSSSHSQTESPPRGHEATGTGSPSSTNADRPSADGAPQLPTSGDTGSASNESDGGRSSAGSTPGSSATGTGAALTGSDAAAQALNEHPPRIVPNPSSVLVLVNKQYALPQNYVPADMVVPNVPFLYGARDIPLHYMRKVAADALEKLVAGAASDGLHIVSVSAYRSNETQRSLFDQYVQSDGLAAAEKYSALPGESEHATGLAIDVSGASGDCAVEDCFANTPEAKWLAEHAADYGFIIRYPLNKESITGYQYEPWHIRYVGVTVAKAITAKGITLEQYLQASS